MNRSLEVYASKQVEADEGALGGADETEAENDARALSTYRMLDGVREMYSSTTLCYL